MLEYLAWITRPDVGLPMSVAIAAMAVIGYVVGRRQRRSDASQLDAQASRELRRAAAIAAELEAISSGVRKEVSTHLRRIKAFQSNLDRLCDQPADDTQRRLIAEAESILPATLELAGQLSIAYEQMRQQSTQLLTFSDVRTDPLTGIGNRRAMNEQIEMLFAILHRYRRPFSLAILDIDHFANLNETEGHLAGDQILQQMAESLDEAVRTTDIVARYGGGEFVVVMPETDLEGACVFGERLRVLVEDEFAITISVGITEAQPADDVHTLLSRADSALYSAKAAGRNALFKHDGTRILAGQKGPNGSAGQSGPAAELAAC